MTTTQAAFGPRADRSALGRLGAPMGSPGQCKAVYPLLDHAGWLFKEYRPNQIKDPDEIRLTRLVGLPDRLTAVDRDLLLRGTCWPRTQVVDGGRTVGVVIPAAAQRFHAALSGPDGDSEVMPLLLTHLAMPDDTFKPVGLRVPSLETRLAVCADLVAVADLFERHGLVYGDWGYKNIFWSQRDSSAFFIDTDACSFGPQPWVESFGFADPFTPANQQVDTFTDRFRCAIAIAACLVGDREPQRAVSGLAALRSADGRVERLATVVRQIATAADRTKRLPIRELQLALSGATPAATKAGATTNTTRADATPDHMNILSWDTVEPPPPRLYPPRRTTRTGASSTSQPASHAPSGASTTTRPAATSAYASAGASARPTRSPSNTALRAAARRRRQTVIGAVAATVVALATVISILVYLL